MAEFDKAKFIKDRILSTAELAKGVITGDPSDIAQGLYAKLEPMYEDILKNAKTEEEALEALKKAPTKRMGFVFGGAGILIDLLNITKINDFKYDVFAGTSKEDGKTLYYNEDKNTVWYGLKTAVGAGINFVMTKNIFTGALSLLVDFTDIFKVKHTYNTLFRESVFCEKRMLI